MIKLTNKNIFKEMYNLKINKDKNYNKILEGVQNNKQENKNFKWQIISICTFIFLCGVIGFNLNNKKYAPSVLPERINYDIYINEIEKPKSNLFNEICLFSDDFIRLDLEALEKYYGTKVVPTVIPKDLVLNHKYDMRYGYYKDDNYGSGVYYDQNFILYEDKENNRSLSIVVAKDRKIHYDIDHRNDNPNKKYVTSKINDKELYIFHYVYDDYYYEEGKVIYSESELEKKNYDCYYTFFEKDGVEFDITSYNINLTDFVNSLASIIN